MRPRCSSQSRGRRGNGSHPQEAHQKQRSVENQFKLGREFRIRGAQTWPHLSEKRGKIVLREWTFSHDRDVCCYDLRRSYLRALLNSSFAHWQNFSSAGLTFPLREIIPIGTRF